LQDDLVDFRLARDVHPERGLAVVSRLETIRQDEAAHHGPDAVRAHHEVRRPAAAVTAGDVDVVALVAQVADRRAVLDRHAGFDGAVGEDLVQLGPGDAVHAREPGNRRSGDVVQQIAADVQQPCPALRCVALPEALVRASYRVERAERVDRLDDPDAVDRRVQVGLDLQDRHAEPLAAQRDRRRQAADTGAHDENFTTFHLADASREAGDRAMGGPAS
jgi:hypothetical protein